MKRIIYEFIRTNQENKTEIIINTVDLKYCRLYLNPYHFCGLCGCRCDTIYCDSRFMEDLTGQEFINEVLKPMLCWKHPEGEGFRLFNI